MTDSKKQSIIRRILKHREAIKTHDEALGGLLSQLGQTVPATETTTVAGKKYSVRNIFADGDSTWRPARVHKFHLVEVHD